MKLSSEGKRLLEHALTKRAWTLDKLSEQSNFSIATVKNFSARKKVSRITFVSLCNILEIDWEIASGEEANAAEELATSSLEEKKITSHSSLPSALQLDEDIIERVKERCRQRILEQHSRMRLLSGQEIRVDQLYVDVWLLERPEHTYIDSTESLLNSFDCEGDRLALSKRIQRNPGFEIAKRSSRLIILGKPGSGKTTFLKHLAVDWCKGEFQLEKIAVLIELRQICGKDWSLISAISKELDLKEKKEILFLLEQGKFLVMMDGLDEVSTDELRRIVKDQLKQISESYPEGNRFILTCRTQIIETNLSGFTFVEVADFNPQQVRQFVLNWFTENEQSETRIKEQWKKVEIATINQPDLRELTATPVLLSLMCWILQDQREIPTNRGWLYRKGIRLLLSRWNKEKEIEGWEVGTEVYRNLSFKEKELLLIEIAAHKFENPKNFVLFDEDELIEQISRRLKLTNEQDLIAVLKAIETQHGLLIERADELWSFSHLTFQEYFTVQWLTQLSSHQLASKIANWQWQEVVKQLVRSQQPADRLLRLIKQAIDKSIEQELDIQFFLSWLLQKSDSIRTNYKSAAIRAFYFSLAVIHARDRDLVLASDPDHAIAIAHALALIYILTLAFDLDHTFVQILDLDCTFDLGLDHTFACVLDHTFACILDRALDLHVPDLEHSLKLELALYDFALAFALARALTIDRAPDPDRTYARVYALALDIDRTLDFDRFSIRAPDLSTDLISCLRQLRNKLPTSRQSTEIQRWWLLYGVQWIEQLRQVMIEHRNIGHDWQFTPEQKQQLQQYYEANKFLVKLMKITGSVTEDCRTEIEDGLLLPWTELQRRQPHLYGELE
ncbi:MAG: NACHT domain-containing protein [Cyanobacteria bacterium P01_G01_bin.54]